jgi:Restriction endonuclease
MKEPSTEAIAAWIADALDTTDWVKLSEVVADILEEKWNSHSRPDCEALAEDREEYIAEQLRNNAANSKAIGQIYPIAIDESEPYVKSISEKVTYEINVLRNMNPYMFEEHCRNILSGLGGRAFVTQKSNDGGIDFYATNIRFVPEQIPYPLHAAVTVVGQAKRYNQYNLVTINDVRQFVGSTVRFLSDLRSRKVIPDAGPVLMAFWTTASFHSSAIEYGRNVGLWTADGRALIDLSRHCKVPIAGSE